MAVAMTGRARGSGVGSSPPAGLPAEERRQGRDGLPSPQPAGTAGWVSPSPLQACMWVLAGWGVQSRPVGRGQRTLPFPGAGWAEGESAVGSSPPRFALPPPTSPPQASEGTQDAEPRGRAGAGVCFPLGVGGREKKTEKQQQPPAFPFL